MASKSISVIIPNYNGKHLLEANLPSVIDALENSGITYEILLVDDASKDSSVAFIKQTYPQIKVLQNSVNSGFSVTCNNGIFASAHELILLLNTDIQLTARYFDDQFKYFEKDDTFGVMGKIVGVDGRMQDTARRYRWQGFKLKANTFFYSEDPAFWTPTAYLSGANALVDAKKLKALGGFDAIYSPFYYEDFDLGLRAWRLGWKCYYHHFSYCIHQTSSTTKNYKTRFWVKAVFFRNRFIVHAIHLEKGIRLIYYVQILLNLLFMWLGLNFFYYKAWYSVLLKRDAIRRSRQSLSALMKKYDSNRGVSDVIREMDTMLQPTTIIYSSKQK